MPMNRLDPYVYYLLPIYFRVWISDPEIEIESGLNGEGTDGARAPFAFSLSKGKGCKSTTTSNI